MYLLLPPISLHVPATSVLSYFSPASTFSQLSLTRSLQASRILIMNMEQAINVRSSIRHFRILIIGRANAGKTTILKKVCNSGVEPVVFSPSGERIDPTIVEGSAKRGEHSISNELIFKSNPQFIFHDSRGFESGSPVEMNQVRAFIEERAATTQLSKQLHAIWYCLPTDSNRPLLAAEEWFFKIPGSGDEQFSKISGTGKVPLIVIFTKFDGLVTKAFGRLRREGKDLDAAHAGKAELAQEMLTTNYIDRLKKAMVVPSAYVRLEDMRLQESSCVELMNTTANTLNDNTLRLLFVSVQQNNIDLCIRWAVKGTVTRVKAGLVEQIVKATLAYFGHVWFQHVAFCTDASQKKFPGLEEFIRTPLGLAQFSALLCICIEQTFIEASASGEGFGPAFSTALAAYVGSSTEAEVIKEITGEFDPKSSIEVQVEKLCNIIKTHRLRICIETA
ncbi:hypothetical protein B0H11DRAFT_1992123 [Mycena galericulata]|nr:hypothetical protein B0H11DRAFT_1992123 [Mycena galericulata]